jgi:hypothetical protein
MRARVGQAVLVLFLGWLYGGDLLRAAQLARAPFAAMTQAPSVPLAVVGAAVALLGVAAFFRARARAAFYGLGVALLLFDFGVLSSGRPPRSTDELVSGVVSVIADQAREQAEGEGVSGDVAPLRRVLDELGAPPFFVEGVQLERWALEVKSGCAGPLDEVAGRRPGTVLYCVSADRQQAWVTAVTLDGAFGAPRVRTGPGFVGVVSRAAAPYMWDADAPAPR